MAGKVTQGQIKEKVGQESDNFCPPSKMKGGFSRCYTDCFASAEGREAGVGPSV